MAWRVRGRVWEGLAQHGAYRWRDDPPVLCPRVSGSLEPRGRRDPEEMVCGVDV